MTELHQKMTLTDRTQQNQPVVFDDSEHLAQRKEYARNVALLESMIHSKKIDFTKLNPIMFRNKDFIRTILRKFPKDAVKLRQIIDPSILDDFEFAVEIYHLTKCITIFGEIRNLEFLFQLLEVDLDFLNSAYSRALTIPFMRKCLKTYPILIRSDMISDMMMREYRSTRKAISEINTLKTFLLCVMKRDSKINWMRGCGGIYTRMVCDYVRVFPMDLVKNYIDPIPQPLSLKCKRPHRCGCVRFGDIGERLSNRSMCESHPKVLCENCPNFHDRKLWVQLFRTLATSYGFRVC